MIISVYLQRSLNFRFRCLFSPALSLAPPPFCLGVFVFPSVSCSECSCIHRHVVPRPALTKEDAPTFNRITSPFFSALLSLRTQLCSRRMETDDVSVREQLFHNRVRETIVSTRDASAALGYLCIPGSIPSASFLFNCYCSFCLAFK